MTLLLLLSEMFLAFLSLSFLLSVFYIMFYVHICLCMLIVIVMIVLLPAWRINFFINNHVPVPDAWTVLAVIGFQL